MNKLLTAAIALSIAGSTGAAIAQPQHAQGGHEHRTERHDDRAERQDEHRAEKYEQKQERRAEKQERKAERRFRAGRYQAPRGYQARQWRHGEQLPASYRTRAYMVDYRAYRLAPPPRGYQYVRVGDDVVLTQTNNGAIASVIQQLFQ